MPKRTPHPKKNSWVYAIDLALGAIFIFLFFLYPASDADLGWHYRYGESFFQNHSLLKNNTFSFTMPDYIWANHSWGYDLFLYQLFRHFSFTGLTLSASLIITLSFLISVIRKNPVPGVGLSALIFAFFGQHLLNTGLRSQMLSLLFLSLIWRLFETPSLPRWKLFIIPLIFMVWANLHGQFIIGLGVILVYLIAEALHKPLNRPRLKTYALLFTLSSLVTFINPFGLKLHLTAAEHLFAPTLKYIFEWMPWEINTPRMLLFILYSLIFWWLFSKAKSRFFKKRPGFAFNLVAINLLSFKARRMIPVFLLFSLPDFSSQVYSLKPIRRLSTKLIFLIEIIILILAVVFTLTFLLPKRPLFNQSWSSYCQIMTCTEGLINFLNHNQISGRVFNGYSLGGVLSLRSPQIKPFIDGRMVAWHEGSWYPFADYNTIVHNLPGARDLFHRYQFDYVIVFNQSEITPVLEKVEQLPLIYRDHLITVFANPYRL